MTIANAINNWPPVLPLSLPSASTGDNNSYFTAVPELPPTLTSHLVRSTPTVYSPLPITPPTLPRRPSSAGSRQPATYQFPFHGPGAARTDVKAVPADSRSSAHQYAALRVAQASAAASAAKESAVARLQAKHEAWSKTAQIRIESESASLGLVEAIVSGHSPSSPPLVGGHDTSLQDKQEDRKEKSSLRDGFTRLTNTLRPVAETSSFHHSSSSTSPSLCISPGFIDYSTLSTGNLAKRPSLASQTSFSSTKRGSISSVSSGLGRSGGSQSSSFTGRFSTSSNTSEAQQPTAVPPSRIFGAASTTHAAASVSSKARHRSHTISGNTSSSTPTRPSPSLLAKGATEPPPRPEPLPKLDMSFQSLSNMPEAGPSSAVSVSTSPISAKGSSDAPKKKRIGKDGLPREGKRKKVSKACLACQKSHLTCDEQRPCTRCVKKGFADQCVEGVRKKAKYLLEAGDRQSPDQSESPTARFPSVPPDVHTAPLHTSYSPTTVPGLSNLGDTNILPSLSDASGMNMNLPSGLGGLGGVNYNLANPMDQHGMDVWLAPAPAQQTLVDGDVSGGYDGGRGMSPIGGKEADWGSMFVGGSDNAFGFGTTASNEYAMLDAMLNSMSPVFPFDFVNDGIQGDSDPLSSTGRNPLDPVGHQRSSYNQPGSIVSPNWPNSASNAGFTPPGGISGQGLIMTDTSLNTQQQPDKGWGWNGPKRQAPAGVTSVEDGSAGNSKPSTNRVSFSSTVNRSAVDQAPQITVKTEPLTTSPVKTTLNPTAAAAVKGTGAQRPKSGAEVYHSVTKPFDYTEGYHRLMEWMSRSFEQQEVLRVVKALAAFRPSLIALQMPMSEEDEVFLERSFQRTLIELEKLISYSATPTAVWRRTGDLVYANPEFCSLLGKQQSELLSGKTYIYHLLARSSEVDG